MFSAILALVSLLAVLAITTILVAGWSGKRRADVVVEQIEACLPQTQCGQCLYPGCKPYAEAIAAGEADINQCPPGGQDTITALAQLLGRASKKLNPSHGQEGAPQLAFIREELCIGCKLCIKACPVDAILGSTKVMHTVIAVECTGCELCIAPCPVDCIDMIDIPVSPGTWVHPSPQATVASG